MLPPSSGICGNYRFAQKPHGRSKQCDVFLRSSSSLMIKMLEVKNVHPSFASFLSQNHSPGSLSKLTHAKLS